MPIFNAFGAWEDLGTINPLAEQWQFFPLFPKSKNSTFWLFQHGDLNLIPKLQVRAYIRAAYYTGSSYIFDRRWVPIYAKDEPEVFNYPYPPDLIRDPLPQRQFQARYKTRLRVGQILPEFNWTLQLFEKTDTLAIYPGDLYPAEIQDGTTTS